MAELIQVHNPVNSSGKPRIVFIHGLDGHLRHTWMANKKDASTLWPKWIGEDTGCPVWLLGYGASMSRWKADAMALPRQATAILERLCTEQAMHEGPLVLVGHSLGGLVIKTLLRQGIGHDVERHNRLARNIKGIAFVGTPHFGSTLASIAAWLRLVRSNPQVSDLRMDNAHLEELNQSFRKLCHDLKIRARVYTETEPVRLPGWLGRLLPGITIVSPTSSQPHIPGEAGTPIEADHITICKPLNRNVTIHTSMVAFVKEVEAAAQSQGVAVPHTQTPLTSDRFEAISPDKAQSMPVHLAFATYGVKLKGAADVPVCATICLVTDSPDRLRKWICPRISGHRLTLELMIPSCA
ncbi:lipase family alpha/beta hydrolase [Ralstonia syzygii]|uniref:lipase family alpha/beta hydrolase n=1 Tax=Ralstonia syzygii TaxID=28097 RepID=UPI0035124AF8